MKKIIVTGAAGFVGCNLVDILLRNGYFVYAVNRPRSQHNYRLTKRENICNIDLDISNIGKLNKIINNECECFFHLAWYGERNDFRVQNENIFHTIKAVEIAKELGCKKFICTGSQAEYGIKRDLITEEMLPEPNTAYGTAKLAACYLSRQRARELDISWVWGRIFSVYGKYEPDTTLIAYLVKSLKKNIIPQLTSGEQNWDYLYSVDCGKALLALLKNGQNGEIYNIANGKYHSLKIFSEAVRKIINNNGTISYDKEKTNNVSLQPSVEKIYYDTGWKADTDFVNGIREAYL